MSDKAPSYAILWASQTGNAEWIAKAIHKEAQSRGFTGECFVMNEFELANMDKTGVLIFVTSNTGDGDPPDNSSKFWRFLRRQKQKDYLAQAKITVLGLGDTNYTNFNNSAVRLEKKVKELGATVFYEKGMADDAEGLENVVDPWIANLWSVLAEICQQKVSEGDQTAEITKGVSEVEIAPMTAAEKAAQEPFSMTERRSTIPETVAPYTGLPNSLVKGTQINGDSKPAAPLSHKIHVDTSALENATQLTGLPRVPAAYIKLVKVEKNAEKPLTEKLPRFVYTPTPIIEATVSKVSCISRKGALKRTLHLELDLGEHTDFQPGDAFGVIAPNDEDLVQAILTRLGIKTAEEEMQQFSVEGDDLPSHLKHASGVTLIDLFRYGLDLTTAPRKALLRMLGEYTSDAQEKNLLMFLCSKQGLAQFNSLRDQQPTLLDLLVSFPSCNPPIERLLDTLPAHMPRYYSIANSPLAHPHAIRFAFNIVQYTTPEPYNVARKGVATTWLDNLTGLVEAATSSDNTAPVVEIPVSQRISVPIFFKINNNGFVLPTDTTKPLLLIGPGTGIAPFIGFLEHRDKQRQIRRSLGGVGAFPDRDIATEFGEIRVYYGFRERSKDYLFDAELKEFVDRDVITHLELAVSRESENKVYVQDLIRRDQKDLYDFIVNKGALIYVCGDAKGMATGVHEALANMLVENEQLEKMEAMKTLTRWITEKKYLRDLWA
ncbi:hypothetical protein K450DRAFT_230196 [Umbelopsis ramanniana AG]|uniref:Methionine synthase reductase n=1 Tax=Umbelopsis ramanniana AG TaxID=1314678 RepID=A0AAD5EEJ2_UMBRA|nr:uncharacterized protein K450DRAFT_230196 [Umbelopsis ramanniana AG]KAI8581977.1 hypothetical protein K450DRAFT_230196 [Umbelopsis ramanniana AG]